jgi:cytochrome c6
MLVVRRNKLLRIILLILLLAIAIFKLTFIHPALAAETTNGAKIFKANCASCHIGGGNILIDHKTLKKEALSQYLANYDTEPIPAIIYQVTNGKGAMPAFKEKLSSQEILEVAAYVFQKAEQGW